MLQRKITEKLAEWKTRQNKKSLVVLGARQVGKTFAIREFGRQNYREVLEVNFKELPSAKDIFSGDLSVQSLVTALKFRFTDKEITPDSTLIFFDEIQECAEAITALKFWTADGRYDVIASGSLLGIDYNRASSYPVGYVDYLAMYGLDFEEFLWSQGIGEELLDFLRVAFQNRSVVPKAVNEQMMALFRTFMALGGMPEVVQTFADSRDFRQADRVQKALLQGYLYDIAHYASSAEKIKAEKCFLPLGRQLLEKENHKFQYKDVEKNGKAQKFLSSVKWLERANMVCTSRNVTAVKYDLCDYELTDNFRAYTTDLSLLVAMRDIAFKQQLVDNTLAANTKGGIYECAVADALVKKGHTLHFYRNESSKREIEFLIQKEGRIVPIEVKGGNSRATSLAQLMKGSEEIPEAYKFIDGNVGTGTNRIVTLPLYMVQFL